MSIRGCHEYRISNLEVKSKKLDDKIKELESRVSDLESKVGKVKGVAQVIPFSFNIQRSRAYRWGWETWWSREFTTGDGMVFVVAKVWVWTGSVNASVSARFLLDGSGHTAVGKEGISMHEEYGTVSIYREVTAGTHKLEAQVRGNYGKGSTSYRYQADGFIVVVE